MKESYKKDKYLNNKSETNPEVTEENVENIDQNQDKDLAEKSTDNTEIKKHRTSS